MLFFLKKGIRIKDTEINQENYKTFFFQFLSILYCGVTMERLLAKIQDSWDIVFSLINLMPRLLNLQNGDNQT